MCYRSLNKVCALIYGIKLCNDSVTVCAVVRRAMCSVVFIFQNRKRDIPQVYHYHNFPLRVHIYCTLSMARQFVRGNANSLQQCTCKFGRTVILNYEKYKVNEREYI